MTDSRKIAGTKSGGKKPKQMVSQSIPAHFYKTYIPPKAPKMDPVSESSMSGVPAMTDFSLPDANSVMGVMDKSEFSLKNDTLPSMSLPVHMLHKGVGKKHTAQFTRPTTTTTTTPGKSAASKEDEADDTPSLKAEKGNIQVGSFTCFQLLGGRQMPPSAAMRAYKPDASTASASSGGAKKALKTDTDKDKKVAEAQWELDEDSDEEDSD